MKLHLRAETAEKSLHMCELNSLLHNPSIEEEITKKIGKYTRLNETHHIKVCELHLKQSLKKMYCIIAYIDELSNSRCKLPP
jgi:hypothetical protein